MSGDDVQKSEPIISDPAVSRRWGILSLQTCVFASLQDVSIWVRNKESCMERLIPLIVHTGHVGPP